MLDGFQQLDMIVSPEPGTEMRASTDCWNHTHGNEASSLLRGICLALLMVWIFFWRLLKSKGYIVLWVSDPASSSRGRLVGIFLWRVAPWDRRS